MKEVRYLEPLPQGKLPHFPADRSIVSGVGHLLLAKGGHVDDACDMLLEDPVSVIEILSIANREFHAGEKPAIWSIKVALLRLGTEQALDILDELKNQEVDDAGSPVRVEFEALRLRARKIGKIAGYIAEIVDSKRKEECQIAALMTEVGYMYALQRFKTRYLNAAHAGPRKRLAYRLEQELDIDVDEYRLEYLTEKWFPQSLLFVFDPEIECRNPSEEALRFITEAAQELLDAGDKVEKYASEAPAKSALNSLNLTNIQRAELVQRVIALLDYKHTSKKEVPKALAQVVVPLHKPEPSKVVYFEAKVEYIETSQAELERSLNHFSEQNQRVFQLLKGLVEDAETSKKLIEEVLSALTEEGPFKRASVLEFSPDSCSFCLLAQVGSKFEADPPVAVNDPWSPIARGSTEIRSFSAGDISDPLVPLGSNAFAISPLKGKTYQRLALYADCGDGGVVPFEARRVFRAAIGVLNSVLPTLPE